MGTVWKSLWVTRSRENTHLGETLWMWALWNAFTQWESFQARTRIHTETLWISALRESFQVFHISAKSFDDTILNTSTVEEPFSLKILWSTWTIALSKNFITGKNVGYPSAFHLFLYVETQQNRTLMIQIKFASVSASLLIGIHCISSSYCWSKLFMYISFTSSSIFTTFIMFK